MKALKKILISLLIIVVLLVVVSFFLPGHYAVKRSVTINAPMEQVIAQVNDFKNWEKWSPWIEKDSTIENTYEGSIDSDTYKMSWTSKESGVGSMSRQEMVKEEASASLKYKLAFTEPFQSESTNTFLFEKAEDGVKVTWTDEGELGNNPIMKYMGLFFDGMIGPDFEKGLANLKAYAEDPANQKPAEPEKMQVNGFDAQIMNMDERTVVGIRKMMQANELDSSDFAENYSKLGDFCGKNNIQPMGAPIAIYHSYDPEGSIDVTFAFPVAADATAPDSKDIIITKVPAAQVLEITYVGPYSGMEPTWMAIDGWLAEKGLMQTGAPWEEYIDDPANVAESELRTKIVVPVSEKIEMEESSEGESGGAGNG